MVQLIISDLGMILHLIESQNVIFDCILGYQQPTSHGHASDQGITWCEDGAWTEPVLEGLCE